MCGDLRRENLQALAGKDPQPEILIAGWGSRGDQFHVTCKDGTTIVAEFNGHARSENLHSWYDNGWEDADLRVIEYTEGHGNQKIIYKVPSGHTIKCVTKEVSRGKRVFNIITREARSAELYVHSRFPITEPRRY